MEIRCDEKVRILDKNKVGNHCFVGSEPMDQYHLFMTVVPTRA